MCTCALSMCSVSPPVRALLSLLLRVFVVVCVVVVVVCTFFASRHITPCDELCIRAQRSGERAQIAHDEWKHVHTQTYTQPTHNSV